MLRQTIIAASIAVASTATHAAQPLQLKVYNAGEGSFHANAVVVSGEHEAMVIDSGFTRADGYRIAANVLDSGKTLKTILISNADPDYYFGAAVLKQLFPQAEVVATPAVASKIQAKLAGKLAFWGPKMGANSPQQPIVPTALKTDSLSVDGEKIELRGTGGVLAHRPYVWIPSLRAIAGNVAVFSGLHVWTADTQPPAERRRGSRSWTRWRRSSPPSWCPATWRPAASWIARPSPTPAPTCSVLTARQARRAMPPN
ncbi:MBL fold metallo-hydrolase [Vogesella fluminis]|uniref:MBL fold metallo-hydrolase n=1 Tax=Vogesella fluminis TaxID=1069161 RepID=UPI003642AF01